MPFAIRSFLYPLQHIAKLWSGMVNPKIHYFFSTICSCSPCKSMKYLKYELLNCSCPSADILCYTMQECLFVQIWIACFLVVCKYFSLQVNFQLHPGDRFSHKVPSAVVGRDRWTVPAPELCQSQRQRQQHMPKYQTQTPRQLHKHTQKVGKCRPPSAPSLWQRPMSGAGAMLVPRGIL